jgi:hypothetical protein
MAQGDLQAVWHFKLAVTWTLLSMWSFTVMETIPACLMMQY